MSSILRRISWPIVLTGLIAPFSLNCAAINKATGAAGLPGIPSCPDMSKPDEIEKFDFAGSFKLQAPVAAKVKAGVGAAVEIKAIADRLDGDLKTACGAIAHDLGDGGDYKDGQEACKAAIKWIGDTRAKIGASAKIVLDASEPHCGLDVQAYGDCAASCDPTIKPGSADIQCDGGKLQGSCGAQCSGDCEASAAAACSGECSGTCDADISGACDANCDGKCDGKPSKGAACSGKCDGKCSGNVKGTCKGKCGGSCHMSAAASCSGTCTGSCSAKMEAPKCTGTMKPPSIEPNCKAKCDAKVQANVQCTPPHVTVRITGAADAKAAAAFQTTIEKNLPLVLNTAVGMAKHIPGILTSVKSVVEGVQAVVKTAATDKIAGPALIACVAKPFAGVADAAAGVSASVNVSVSVNASVSGSASGSASGKAGGGG
jgi:hypothetical protein